MSGCDTIIDVRFAQGLGPVIEGESTSATKPANESVEVRDNALWGAVAVAMLPRLLEQVREPVGEIQFRVRPIVRADDKPALEVELRGTLKLSCQRCLGALEWSLISQRQIVFTPTASLPDIEDEEEFTDYVPIDSRAVLRDMIEDEVLLALPMVPAHAHDECGAAVVYESSPKEKSPFAVLLNVTKQ